LRDFDDILGVDGPLTRHLPGFAPRRPQLDMARCVGAALEALEPLIVEAGTGTGKTFAYLVPALLSGRHVIISTGTKTLQDQLFHRDLPQLSAVLGRPVTIALLKGRANYLCRHRLKLAAAAPELDWTAGELGSENSRSALQRIEQWAQRTRSGDVSEVTDVKEGDPVWAAVTSTRDNCLGSDCPEYTRCHVIAARRAAQAADVVIVNHHLLLADLALKETGFGELLPGTEAVILDEAHQVPEIAAQFFGANLGSRQLAGFARDTAAELQRAALRAPAVHAELKALETLAAEFRGALRKNPAHQGANRVDWRSLDSGAAEILAELEARLGGTAQLLKELAGDTGVEQCARRAAELAARCATLRAADEEAGVRWVEARFQHWTVQYTPFEVADKFQQFMSAAPCAWIFTSATLAVGEDFTHFTDRIGAPQAHTVRIESPFDYRRQALLYLPEKMSDPSAPSHSRDVIEAALPLVEAAGGGAFILFTSHRALSEGAAWLKQKWSHEGNGFPPFPLLIQGDGSRDALLREFRERGNAVLLGTGSFWEGVDVKGDALALVVIDKLPFASPDDPVLNARLEGIRRRGGNPFFDYQVPQAVLALKQGVGRLIRDAGDFGVIVLCDPRLKTKSYGRVFLESLPPMPVTTATREAVRFLQAHSPHKNPRDPPRES
jgi:ATP-dependent DNA helicase DinG